MLKYGIAIAPLGITIAMVFAAAIVMMISGEESRAFEAVGSLAGAWLFGGPILTFIMLSAVIIHDVFKKAERRLERKSMGREKKG
ncbi:MAG: hypothetical protein ACYTFG_05415 [Planctomycetota bacterium]|jgi:hypothetical protein